MRVRKVQASVILWATRNATSFRKLAAGTPVISFIGPVDIQQAR